MNQPYWSKLWSEWKGIFLSKAFLCPSLSAITWERSFFAALVLSFFVSARINFQCNTGSPSLPSFSPLQDLIDYAYLPKFRHSQRRPLYEKPDQFFTLPPRHVGEHNENAWFSERGSVGLMILLWRASPYYTYNSVGTIWQGKKMSSIRNARNQKAYYICQLTILFYPFEFQNWHEPAQQNTSFWCKWF